MAISRERTKAWRQKNPWVKNLEYAQRRCRDKRHSKYKFYGGKGIACLLKVAEAKLLWVRDKAMELKRPSLDRIDNAGPYAVWNCRFIEYAENWSARMYGGQNG